MEFVDSLCVFDEALYTACGHVVTRVKHVDHCIGENHDPFSRDHILDYRCDGYHFEPALILSFSCPFCTDAQYNAANTWRSDRNDEAPPRVSIQPRLLYWTEYITEQRLLFSRQEFLEINARVARMDFQNYTWGFPNGFPEGPEYESVSWAFIRLDRMRGWYLAHQNYHFGQIRRGIPDVERRHIFDEEVVNPRILAPVSLADVPPDEICGICRFSLSDAEALGPNGIRRVFCGVHIYHHDCIVPWFREGGHSVSCPTCRATRYVLRPPAHEWQDPRVEEED